MLFTICNTYFTACKPAEWSRGDGRQKRAEPFFFALILPAGRQVFLLLFLSRKKSKQRITYTKAITY
jgi:hypothetical protein